MDKDGFNAIITEINESKLHSVWQPEDECELFYDSKPALIKQGLNVDKHRWYEVSTNVYEIDGFLQGVNGPIDRFFLGINGPSDLFSETMDWESCRFPVEAFEMEEVNTVTYIKKGLTPTQN